MTMTFNAFMSRMLKPTYVWRMASGISGLRPDQSEDQRPLARSARTRMRNAQRAIDDLVLQRAAVIADERRCAALGKAVGAVVPAVRCEFQRGHGPVGPGIENPRLAHVEVKTDWDHGAPSAKTWWKGEMTMQMENADG